MDTPRKFIIKHNKPLEPVTKFKIGSNQFKQSRQTRVSSSPSKNASHMKRNSVLVSSILFLSFICVMACFVAISNWYDNHEVAFHFPVEIHLFAPVKIVTRPKQIGILSPIGTGDKKKLTSFDVGAISDKIYTLESSGGKNDGCRDLGKFKWIRIPPKFR